MKKRSRVPGIRRTDRPDHIVAVLEMEKADYEQVVRRAAPYAVHPTWDAYRAWIEKLVEDGARRGRPVAMERCTHVQLDAFCFAAGVKLDTDAMLAYAAHLLDAKRG